MADVIIIDELHIHVHGRDVETGPSDESEVVDEGPASEGEQEEIMAKSKRTQLTEDDFAKLSEERKEKIRAVRPSRAPEYEKPGTDGKAPIDRGQFEDFRRALRRAYESNEYIQRRNDLLLRVTWWAAMRRSEVLQVRKRHLRPQVNRIHIPAENRKNRVEHRPSVPGDLMDDLLEYTSDLGDEDYVFQGDGLRYHGVQPGQDRLTGKVIYKWMQKVRPILVEDFGWTQAEAEGLNMHSLRKGMGREIRRREDTEVARKHLGNKGVEITRRYTRADEDEEGDAIEEMAEDDADIQLEELEEDNSSEESS